MVAISLYRGNLHRVPDVPRQWLMPARKISLKDFKVLVNRRNRALARLRSSSTDIATTSNNPNPDFNQYDIPDGPPQLNLPKVVAHEEKEIKDYEAMEIVDELEKLRDDGVNDLDGVRVDDCTVKAVDKLKESEDVKPVVPENVLNPVEIRDVLPEEKIEEPVNPNLEACKVDATDKEKRKREIEEKLQILNERKHNLVQLLKQILNAEEELRRRNSIQGMSTRPSLPLHVDVTTNESGSTSRQATSRLGSDGNIVSDVEGADADDNLNQNMHSRSLFRVSSMSPSSDSPHRRPFSAVPHPSRATLGVASSPSRFAPTGQQGKATSLPTVSVSGTNYIASSPSPAGSGGTSVFRDARLPSPWN